MTVTPLEAGSASSAGPSFACIRCWKLKKKCDKNSPQCNRCITAGHLCVYSNEPPTDRALQSTRRKNPQDSGQRALNDWEAAVQSSHAVQHEGLLTPNVHFPNVDYTPPSPESDTTTDGSTPARTTVARLTTPIYAPYHAVKHELPEIVRLYLATVNTWFPIVAESRLSDLDVRNGPVPDAETCTLLLAIYLVTKQPTATTNLDNLYSGLKRFHSNLHTVSTKSIPIIQAGILLAMYEQGQSLHQLSYLTIGAAVRVAQAVGMHRTVEIDLETVHTNRAELELQRHMWWILVIMERVLAFYNFKEMRPFASASPKITDYLPSFWSVTGENDGGIQLGYATNVYTQLPDIQFPFTNPLGESVQAIFLLAKVYEHMMQPRLSTEQRNLEVEYLDKLLQAYLVRSVGDRRKQNGSIWRHSCGPYYLSMCTRIRLHMHNLEFTRDRKDQISQESTRRSFMAVFMIAKIGTDSKNVAQQMGMTDEFLSEENMPSFTLCASRDVMLFGYDILKNYTSEEVVGDAQFWQDAIYFYRATFELLKKKWRLAAEFMELTDRENSLMDMT